MKEIVYLNGSYIARDEAKISPDDRGFIFSDGIYEVTKYYKGKPFRLEDHIERLERSLGELDMHYESTKELEEVFSTLLVRNGWGRKDAAVYVQISRGAHTRVHHFPNEITPTVYAFAFKMPSATESLDKGIRVITHQDIRWQRCDIKSVSLLPNTMLFNKAVDQGAGECILIRRGYVTEATHSSVLTVLNGKVITRPLSNLILPGITRKVILEICKNNNIPVEERLFTKAELYNMDEVIIAGTGGEVMPVIEVDDKSIGNKKPGELTRFIQKKFFELTS